MLFCSAFSFVTFHHQRIPTNNNVNDDSRDTTDLRDTLYTFIISRHLITDAMDIASHCDVIKIRQPSLHVDTAVTKPSRLSHLPTAIVCNTSCLSFFFLCLFVPPLASLKVFLRRLLVNPVVWERTPVVLKVTIKARNLPIRSENLKARVGGRCYVDSDVLRGGGAVMIGFRSLYKRRYFSAKIYAWNI